VGAAAGGALAGGCSAGAGTTVAGNASGRAAGSIAGSGAGVTAGVDWVAACASWAVEETSAPTLPVTLSPLPLTDATAEEMVLPTEPAWWESSASAAGADTASQVTAAAPARRTGRRGRSADHDRAAMVMLTTPKSSPKQSTIVYSLSLLQSESPDPQTIILSIRSTPSRPLSARRWDTRHQAARARRRTAASY
jgi:hypothetical protein